MLTIWLSVALVNISGYQPIAEQTWVQLSPDYYPPHGAIPPIFVAWHGNQFPPLAQKRQSGHWQLLFPVRLMPPFALFEGEAQPSKAYLARLKRIDEMAYGMAPHLSVKVPVGVPLSPDEGAFPQPFIAEFSLPRKGMEASGEAPVFAALARQDVAMQPQPAGVTIPSVPMTAGKANICHRVVPGETLWRIVTRLVEQGKRQGGADPHSYLLALVEENRASLGQGIKIRTGQSLYCPRAETLAQFEAMGPAQRQQQLARLERGR